MTREQRLKDKVVGLFFRRQELARKEKEVERLEQSLIRMMKKMEKSHVEAWIYYATLFPKVVFLSKEKIARIKQKGIKKPDRFLKQVSTYILDETELDLMYIYGLVTKDEVNFVKEIAKTDIVRTGKKKCKWGKEKPLA